LLLINEQHGETCMHASTFKCPSCVHIRQQHIWYSWYYFIWSCLCIHE